MLKFGAVTIDVSHPAGFASKLLEGDRARYTAVFNDCFRTKEEVEAFSEQFDATIYDDLDEMIDNIDLGLIHCCNWDKHLDYVMHFVRKGKPVFVDKPIVGNMNDLRRIVELEKNGARILGTSALRYAYEVRDVKAKLEESGTEPIFVSTTVGVDEFNYAIHAVELICGIMPSDPVSCRFVGTSMVEGAYPAESYFVRFASGATAIYTAVDKKFLLCHTTVLTSGTMASDMNFTVNNLKLYDAMLPEICNAMEGLDSLLIPVSEMAKPIKVLLAGKASKENGGVEVALDSPLLEETSFDGYAFEEGYADAARKAAEAAKKAAEAETKK